MNSGGFANPPGYNTAPTAPNQVRLELVFGREQRVQKAVVVSPVDLRANERRR